MSFTVRSKQNASAKATLQNDQVLFDAQGVALGIVSYGDRPNDTIATPEPLTDAHVFEAIRQAGTFQVVDERGLVVSLAYRRANPGELTMEPAVVEQDKAIADVQTSPSNAVAFGAEVLPSTTAPMPAAPITGESATSHDGPGVAGHINAT